MLLFTRLMNHCLSLLNVMHLMPGSDVAVSATLNLRVRPAVFISGTLSRSELHYPPVEKEATAIIEAVRKWSHFLSGRHFTLVTDQRSIKFMLDNKKRTKIKNNKIELWRIELASFSYDIQYRPGKDNVALDFLHVLFVHLYQLLTLLKFTIYTNAPFCKI